MTDYSSAASNVEGVEGEGALKARLRAHWGHCINVLNVGMPGSNLALGLGVWFRVWGGLAWLGML